MQYEEQLDGKKSNMCGGTDRPVLVVSFVAVVVGIVALIIGIIAITRPMSLAGPVTYTNGQPGAAQVQPSGRPSGGPPPPPPKRIWTIGYGHDWGPHEYFDAKGYIQGFSFNMIKAVCDAGGIDCRTVWMPYSSCYQSKPGEHPSGGQGLLDSWVDGCLGWLVTVDRIHIFDFSQSYLSAETSYFYTKQGATFNANDLTGKKIGFVSGWYSDEKCVARQVSGSNRGYKLGTEQIIYATTPGDLADLLDQGKIDAAFAGYGDMEKYLTGRLTRLDQFPITCVISGSAMMSKKGSPFLAAWNDGFNKLRSNGGFAQLCAKAQSDHQLQGTIGCLK